MTGRGSWLSLLALLGSSAACDSEVTLNLLRSEAEANAGGFVDDAGTAGTSSAGEGGSGGTTSEGSAGEASAGEAGAGDAGAPSEPPCVKLGDEVCNGGDDDCNGQIDDGCLYTLSWKRGPDSAAIGHQVGGFSFVEPCDAGSLLSGLRIGMGKWLNQVSAVCRQVELTADSTSGVPVFSISASGARVYKSIAPAVSTDPDNELEEYSCPDDWIVSGLSGYTAPEEAKYVRGIAFSCAPLIIGEAGTLDLDRSQEKEQKSLVCVPCSSSTPFDFSVSAPPKQLTSRLFGGVGAWVDRVGIGASQASVVTR